MKRQVYNPYLPSWEYIPDGEPHVFSDRLYIFGSHDRFGGKSYCENDYIAWSTPADDLSDWRYEGVILRREDTPWNTEKKPMYAPDVCQGPDGRYYLYYSVQNSGVTSVAVCDTPAGKYEYYGDVKFPDGRVHGSNPEDWFNFDPAILVDTDGRIWLYSGSGQPSNGRFGHKIVGSFVMELDRDMLTIIDGPRIVIPADWNNQKPNFFEGSSIRHIGEWYYLVYPATDMSGLNYSMSRYPDRGFVWKGRLHSTSNIGYRGIDMKHARYPIGNNHGGLVNVKGQWYIFDHRQTNGSSFGRQGVAEPLTLREDGTFEMAEATSCGMNGGPLLGFGTYPAYICCDLYRFRSLIPVPPFNRLAGAWVTQDGPDYIPPVPTEEHPVNIETESYAPTSYVHVEKPGVLLGYKYFDLSGSHRLTLTCRGKGKGVVEMASAPNAAPVARFEITPSKEWKDVFAYFRPEKMEDSARRAGREYSAKKMPIFLRFTCVGAVDLKELNLG